MQILLTAFIIVYLGLVVVIAKYQRKLMYHPNTHISAPADYGLTGFNDILVTSRSGGKLQFWVHPARVGYPTIIYFHGNAGNLGDRSAKFSAFADNGFGVVALSYRGFGRSEGAPEEQGIYEDARSALDYASTQLGLPAQRLIYFGESLGSGIAVQMATEQAPALVMLEAAYTSVETRSAEMFPYILGVRMLVKDKYNSLAKITQVRAPLLMIHGVADGTIPLRHGKELFAAANEPKSLIVYPDVNHVDYSIEQIISPLMNAVRKYKLIESSE